MAGLTPFQTVGPYLHLGLTVGRAAMTAPGLTTPVAVEGRVLDGAGQGVPDGLVEFWAPGFAMIGRAWTGPDGGYRVETSKPATRVDDDSSVHAPHFAVRVLGRGILTEYLTRVYFADEPDTSRDAVLAVVPAERRQTLIAQPGGAGSYHLDIVLQGDDETVFFAV